MRLRDVEEPDLEVFFEHQVDPEAARLANFPSRDRERFMTHWRTKVLRDPTVLVQTVTVDGAPRGIRTPNRQIRRHPTVGGCQAARCWGAGQAVSSS